MKTFRIILRLLPLACCFAAGSCISTPTVKQGIFLIEGFLTNVPDSTVIGLYREDGNALLRISSDTVIGGRFSISDTISTKDSRKLMLMSDGPGFPGTWLNLWVASGEYIKINGEDRLLPLWKVQSRIPEQQTENGFMELCRPERIRSMELSAMEYSTFRSENFDWKTIDSLRKLSEPLDSLIWLAEIEHLKNTPVSRVWLEKYSDYASFLQWNKEFGHADLIRSLYPKLSPEDLSTDIGQEISGYINLPAIVNVGDDMADGDLFDIDGNLRHLSEFKGEYILLDFWSQWCGPCIESIPEMEEITGLYNGVMTVVSINQDPEDQWKEFVKENNMTGNQWNELRKGNTGLSAAYQIEGIPHYVLISPEGKVMEIWSGYGKGSLKRKLKELID